VRNLTLLIDFYNYTKEYITMQTDDYTPSHLGAAGTELWARLAVPFTWEPEELVILEQMARLNDTQAILAAEARTQPIMLEGSTGQLKLNPLWGELRMLRLAIAKLAKDVMVTEEPAKPAKKTGRGSGSMTTTEAAQKAALARWAR
jgi:hypothetical protein